MLKNLNQWNLLPWEVAEKSFFSDFYGRNKKRSNLIMFFFLSSLPSAHPQPSSNRSHSGHLADVWGNNNTLNQCNNNGTGDLESDHQGPSSVMHPETSLVMDMSADSSNYIISQTQNTKVIMMLWLNQGPFIDNARKKSDFSQVVLIGLTPSKITLTSNNPPPPFFIWFAKGCLTVYYFNYLYTGF